MCEQPRRGSSFSCGARRRACAAASTHAPQTRSQHGRMRSRVTRSFLRFLFLPLWRSCACSGAFLSPRSASLFFFLPLPASFLSFLFFLCPDDLDELKVYRVLFKPPHSNSFPDGIALVFLFHRFNFVSRANYESRNARSRLSVRVGTRDDIVA